MKQLKIPPLDIDLTDDILFIENLLKPFRTPQSYEQARYRARVRELYFLSDMSDPSEPLPITSHRKKIGPIIVRAKKFLVRLMRPVIRITLRRQIIFNQAIINQAETIMKLEAKIEDLEKKIHLLESR